MTVLAFFALFANTSFEISAQSLFVVDFSSFSRCDLSHALEKGSKKSFLSSSLGLFRLLRVFLRLTSSSTSLFVASKHDLIGDLLDVVLDSLGLVLVFEAESLVFDDLALLFLESLSGGALWLLLLGGHFR